MTLGSLSNAALYTDLLMAFPPRPIGTEEQFWTTQKVIDSLIDKGELTEDERDYLHLLGTLVYKYEEQTVDIPDIYGIELLKVLIEDSGLRQKDLVDVFKTESIVSDIVKEKRSLTTEHIEKLSQFFNVSPAMFFKSVSNESERSQK